MPHFQHPSSVLTHVLVYHKAHVRTRILPLSVRILYTHFLYITDL